MDEIRAGPRKWPPEIFIPSDLVAGLMDSGSRPNSAGMSSDAIRRHAGFFTVFATWRLTQGIYRFDEDLYRELTATAVTGDLPVDVLLRMPQWCVYIETPGMRGPTINGGLIQQLGVWIWLDWSAAHKRLSLGLMMLTPDGPVLPLFLPLVGTLEQSMAGLLREAGYNRRAWDAYFPALVSQGVAWLEPVLSLLLYLCSDTADVDRDDLPPCNPQPTHTKRGERLFPAEKPIGWSVGVREGARLRRAREREASGSRSDAEGTRSMRPHMRSAHWAHRWIGPMSGERKLVLRWIHPALVNVDDIDDLPSVIRPVKKAENKHKDKNKDKDGDKEGDKEK